MFNKRNSEQGYNFSILLKCDDNAKTPTFNEAKLVQDSANSKQILQIEGTSQQACPIYEAHFIVKKLRNFKYLYVCVAFVVGLAICFYGLKLFKPTLFIVRIYISLIDFNLKKCICSIAYTYSSL